MINIEIKILQTTLPKNLSVWLRGSYKAPELDCTPNLYLKIKHKTRE